MIQPHRQIKKRLTEQAPTDWVGNSPVTYYLHYTKVGYMVRGLGCCVIPPGTQRRRQHNLGVHVH